MSGRYPPDERARILGLLRNSASHSPDGVPNYTRINRETNVDRTTLKRWFVEAGGAAEPAAVPDSGPTSPPGATTYGPAELAWAAEQLGIDDPEDRDVHLVADILFERNSYTSPTARSSGTKLLAEKVLELRRTAPANDTPKSIAEWVELVVQMPEVLVEAVLASPRVIEDPRIVRAVTGGGEE